ncbi:hypothetical protein Pcac1_g1466 [Phytophthora cactorum]|nr:hypothetical protein Pcac1_g1466 [Phytophthora cactorum]
MGLLVAELKPPYGKLHEQDQQPVCIRSLRGSGRRGAGRGAVYGMRERCDHFCSIMVLDVGLDTRVCSAVCRDRCVKAAPANEITPDQNGPMATSNAATKKDRKLSAASRPEGGLERAKQARHIVSSRSSALLQYLHPQLESRYHTVKR